jgi:5-methyltetrahydropteroyltriglutamate--homocysteine methyltransferase
MLRRLREEKRFREETTMNEMKTTTTGSWFRPPEILRLLAESTTGEVSKAHAQIVEDAERRAIRDQLHPEGSSSGIDWVSNGEQRKAGYTEYLPNRYRGFSTKERVPARFSKSIIEEFTESNPQLLGALQNPETRKAFLLPKIESRLQYTGADLARGEAEDAARLAGEEGAERIFIPSASPGVITLFFANNPEVYPSHMEYLFAVAKEQRKEYEAILSVDGVDLQIDAPDLAMAKQMAGDWDIDFYDALPWHVKAINEATAGLPRERIRLHYCYGNWVGSHRFDADFRRLLKEIVKLNVGTLVGEFANPRHEGDVLILKSHIRNSGWPEGLKLAAGVIDVKTPIVESPETVALRLSSFAEVIGSENVIGGTDCGFETFASVGNIPYAIGLLKLDALVKGARLINDMLEK